MSHYMKRRAAEKLVRDYLGYAGWPEVHLADAAASPLPDGRVRTRTHDLFGAWDILACSRSSVWAIQVTTPKCVKDRKVKIAGRAWPDDWRKSIVTLERERGTALLHVIDLEDDGKWRHSGILEFDAPIVRAHALALKSRKKEPKGAAWKAAKKEAARRKNP